MSEWFKNQRQDWIARRVDPFNRKDLMDQFDISVPQASKDISKYQENNKLIYDKQKKRYTNPSPKFNEFPAHERILKDNTEAGIEFFYTQTIKNKFKMTTTNIEKEIDQLKMHLDFALDLAGGIFLDEVSTYDDGLNVYSNADVYRKVLEYFEKRIEKKLREEQE